MIYGTTKNNNKKRNIVCLDCKAADQKRAHELRTLLNKPEAWRCTCKKIPKTERLNAALNNNQGHKQMCKLTPMKYGETRWDGGNMMKQDGRKLTRDDLEFLLAWEQKQ